MALEAKTTPPSYSLRGRAEEVAVVLARSNLVRGVCLLGSVARGDARPDSDLDLVVLTTAEMRRSELLELIPDALRDEQLSLIPFTTEGWLDEAARGSLFVHHLRLEGVVLFDGDRLIERGFELSASRKPDVDGELRRQVSRLRLYSDLKRLNGEHLFALSHLYAIGKAVAIARCIGLGQTTFVKDDAFARLAECRPDLGDDVEVVARLRPFYDVTHERRPRALPFPPHDVESEVARAIEAIERLAYE